MPFLTDDRYQVVVPQLNMLLEPRYGSELDEQALLGDQVECLDLDGEFTRVHIPFSGKTGWVASAEQKLVSISDQFQPSTHWVCRPRVLTFREPNGCSETSVVLSMNSKVAIGETKTHGRDTFVQVLGLPAHEVAWIRLNSLMPLGTWYQDFVAVQEMFLGVLYQWGARSASPGIDCSRIHSQSLFATGHEYCPADTKDQVNSNVVGELMDYPRRGGLQRGDRLFWKGHVATMVDEKHCIHATDLEPYHQVLMQDHSVVIGERLNAGKGNITAVRRFPWYKGKRLQSLVA